MVADSESRFERIIYEKKGHAAWITINRPEKRNAQDPLTREEISRAFDLGAEDDDVHVMVIRGAGKAFCAGGDIVNFPKSPVEFMENIGLQFNGKSSSRPIEKARAVPKPIIAMVHGLALGAGMELAMACDLVIAAEDAKFGQPEIKVGLIPGGGGTQVLPRIVGEKIAKELVFTGDSISGKEAERIGLVNKAVAEDQLQETVEALVANLLKKSPVALRFAKMSINKTLEVPLSSGLSYESDLCAICFGTEDLKEGAAAFAEKRKPVFKGK
jgi:enoyl-CoA hydratase